MNTEAVALSAVLLQLTKYKSFLSEAESFKNGLSTKYKINTLTTPIRTFSTSDDLGFVLETSC